MSGGYEEELSVPELVSQVMRNFKVDEKTARKIIDFSNELAMERMKKWIYNARRKQKDKAEEIYQLTKKLKKGDTKVIDELEKKILELCVET
jgi:hypothetical protein